MKVFEFYVKQDAVLPLDINSPSFAEEKDQLIAQGFEITGDLVKAESSAKAFEKFKTANLDELAGLASWHLILGGIAAVLGFSAN